MYEYRNNGITKGFILGIVFIALIILAAGLGAFFYKRAHKTTAEEETPAATTGMIVDGNGTVLNDGEIHDMPETIMFSVPRLLRDDVPDDDEIYPFNAIIRANVYPANADDQEVDWTVEFVNPNSTFANTHRMSDCLTVTPTYDGSLVARITCEAPFGEQIRITVTSRYNEDATASCLVDFKQQFLGYNLSFSQKGHSAIMTVNNTNHTGVFCADFDNEWDISIYCTYQKSSVYTVALADSEIQAPVYQLSFKPELATALNNAKAGAGTPPSCYSYGLGNGQLNLFNSSWAEDYTPAELGALANAIRANSTGSVYLDLNDSNGNRMVRYTISINTDYLYVGVESLSLSPNALVFGSGATYSITYKRAGYEDEPDLFANGSEYAQSQQTGGNYPTTYKNGTEVTVSDLKSSFTGTGAGSTSYEFNGWYWDSEMETPFDGTIPEDMVGNVTLYAEITENSHH